MIVVDLVELLSEWWFPLSRTPAEPINRRLGYTNCAGWYRGRGGQMKCPRTAGLGYTNENSAVVARVAPYFLVENTLKDF